MTPNDSIPEKPSRPICGRCARPQSACICRWITPVEPIPEVLILQHPLERRQAKGSAPLLHLSLTGSRLAVGETFDADELRRLLHAPVKCEAGAAMAPTQSGVCGPQEIHPVLLYPETPEMPVSFVPGDCRGMPPAAIRLRLVVLDGTWRKSRKLLHLNPMLQALPRMSLQQVDPSRYRIRKAHAPDQLSTLEAACRALMQLEGNEAKYLPLLHAFEGFVEEQLSRVPSRSRC